MVVLKVLPRRVKPRRSDTARGTALRAGAARTAPRASTDARSAVRPARQRPETAREAGLPWYEQTATWQVGRTILRAIRARRAPNAVQDHAGSQYIGLRAERRAMIDELRQDYPQYSVRRLCQLFAVAPSSYYYRRSHADDRDDTHRNSGSARWQSG